MEPTAPQAGELTVADWEAVCALPPPRRLLVGRSRHDHRPVLGGIVWVIRHTPRGAPCRPPVASGRRPASATDSGSPVAKIVALAERSFCARTAGAPVRPSSGISSTASRKPVNSARRRHAAQHRRWARARATEGRGAFMGDSLYSCSETLRNINLDLSHVRWPGAISLGHERCPDV